MITTRRNIRGNAARYSEALMRKFKSYNAEVDEAVPWASTLKLRFPQEQSVVFRNIICKLMINERI